jgi:hypothetical protein
VLLIFGGILLGGFLSLQGQKQEHSDSAVFKRVDENGNDDNNNNEDKRKIQILPFKVSLVLCFHPFVSIVTSLPLFLCAHFILIPHFPLIYLF